MTLNPEATSMLSLFCEVPWVLAQLNNSAAHPAAMMLRKIRVVGFIGSDVRVSVEQRQKEEGKIKK